MTVHEPTRPIERCPSHPGALLEDIIPATGKTKVEIANLLGISRQQLYDIIRGHPGITATEIVRQLGAEGKESAAIRAALFKMKKAGRVEVEGKGKYIAVPQA